MKATQHTQQIKINMKLGVRIKYMTQRKVRKKQNFTFPSVWYELHSLENSYRDSYGVEMAMRTLVPKEGLFIFQSFYSLKSLGLNYHIKEISRAYEGKLYGLLKEGRIWIDNPKIANALYSA